MNSSTPPRTVSPEKALERLEILCVRAERCTQELRMKLRLWGVAPADADRILLSLKKRKFVDDSRFTRAFVKDKFMLARWGRVKIKMALRKKAIPSELIDSTMAEIIDEKTYAGNLREFLMERLKRLGEAGRTYEGRTKVYRAAVARGYEPAHISPAFRELLK